MREPSSPKTGKAPCWHYQQGSRKQTGKKKAFSGSFGGLAAPVRVLPLLHRGVMPAGRRPPGAGVSRGALITWTLRTPTRSSR
uniref:Uncharacterized protein n=1 Tax=Ralstonia solanacearum TaxID=305 RepID=A0A0S4WHK5_RALSL|nr:protein of unknown function [Ralstonia solanacearum]